jgi:hypothetical protein
MILRQTGSIDIWFYKEENLAKSSCALIIHLEFFALYHKLEKGIFCVKSLCLYGNLLGKDFIVAFVSQTTHSSFSYLPPYQPEI